MKFGPRIKVTVISGGNKSAMSYRFSLVVWMFGKTSDGRKLSKTLKNQIYEGAGRDLKFWQTAPWSVSFISIQPENTDVLKCELKWL